MRVLAAEADQARTSGGSAGPWRLQDILEGGEFRSVRLEFGGNIASAVHEYCEANSLTPPLFYLAAYALALQDIGGRRESAVEFTVGTRSAAGSSWSDPVLVQVAPDDEQTIRDYLGQVRSQIASALRDGGSIGDVTAPNAAGTVDVRGVAAVDGCLRYAGGEEEPEAGPAQNLPAPARLSSRGAITLSVADETGRVRLEVERGGDERTGKQFCRELAERVSTLVVRLLGDPGRTRATLTYGTLASAGRGGSSSGLGGARSKTLSGQAAGAPARDAHDLFGVILPLKRSGTEPPLFCVHPALGLSWCYAMLLGHLPQDRPVYGLQTASLRSPGYLASSIEEIADSYLREIRVVQPHGPYHFLSWSFGGLIAHRLAVLIQEAGEEVALLSVMDAAPLPALADVSEEELFREALSTLLGSDEAADLAMAELPVNAAAEDVKRQIKARNPGFPDLAPATIATLVASTVNHFRLMLDHVPGAFDGNLTFFASAPREAGLIAADPRRWDGHVRGVDRIQLDCDHLDMAGLEAMASIGAHLKTRMRSWNRDGTGRS
ncbi:thioesterase domain-containing protein [Nonomuraea sp. JJY05]|uniref:thioesterase domain-containing protein n=1 Tax=Nonomuraea sp. JJY05 TaxID=3350255 RepID=UPI00373E5C44